MELTPFDTIIKEFLDNYAKEDEAFAKKYANKKKSIQECCKYIYQEVEKNRKSQKCVACSEDEVFGMAIHYYDEEDLVVAGPVTPVEKVESTKPVKPVKEKKTRAKKNAVQEADENMPEPLNIPVF